MNGIQIIERNRINGITRKELPRTGAPEGSQSCNVDVYSEFAQGRRFFDVYMLLYVTLYRCSRREVTTEDLLFNIRKADHNGRRRVWNSRLTNVTKNMKLFRGKAANYKRKYSKKRVKNTCFGTSLKYQVKAISRHTHTRFLKKGFVQKKLSSISI